MTDAELNEIFRAVRHRRTLSWATIEKLANEVRGARKPKENVLPSGYRWNHYAAMPTRMFPPKPDDLPPKAKEVLDRVSASIQRSYEEKAIESWIGAQTCNVVEPELFDLGEALARSSFLPMIRHQSVFHKIAVDPLAGSRKKE